MMSTAKAGPMSPKSDRRSSKPQTPNPAVSTQPRQERLQHLTTQLLWRLQQSSPYHASSSKELALPKLPDDNVDLSSPVKLSKLVPGLEESRGALYQIGVSDDGTLVGLTMDEMDESLATLRVMAASLGCVVAVTLKVIVGDCEWVESAELVDNAVTMPAQVKRTGKLWVVEALVSPNRGFIEDSEGTGSSRGSSSGLASTSVESAVAPSTGSSKTPQLRVAFTGPTTSGKSSLLGTLSTGILDNGRGNSRLCLLKHRHEVLSGVTSSIAQELIGYKDGAIVNYSHGNTESWVDIHNYSEGGRLVFIVDSAGHPRYRRTVLRGLMNWEPHWFILCIAADEADPSHGGYGATASAKDILGAHAAGIDLVKSHMNLCLKAEVPLAIVITKLDLASKATLHKTMTKILDAIKLAGRSPKILQPDQEQHEDLRDVPVRDREKVRKVLSDMSESGSMTKAVPILLTSAVKGRGIGLMHALLERLPPPPTPTAHDLTPGILNPEQPKSLFHIDEVFNLPASYGCVAGDGTQADQGSVVSGYLRFGRLSVGDSIVVGPFRPEEDEPRGSTPDDKPSPGSYGLSISHPSSAELARIAMKNAVAASAVAGEWYDAQVVSIRNLRLPVFALEAGQAGSIGLVLDTKREDERLELPQVRRGMILAVPSDHMAVGGIKLQAASGLTAVFKDLDVETLVVGSWVNIYIASVRASAKISRISKEDTHREERSVTSEDSEEIFSFNEDIEVEANLQPEPPASRTSVKLDLLHRRQWIELGSRVILMEAGSHDKSGLEGFVGDVVEIVD